MSWRIISISNISKLSLEKEQLKIQKDGEEHTIPLEDIGVLLLESGMISLSSALLNACIQHKICVIVCDASQHPSGVLTGYQQHSRQLSVMENQISISQPLKKQVWQSIVKSKIFNQAIVAEHITQKAQNDITKYIDSVKSGDVLNREATAAQKYFSLLFRKNETRSSETKTNAALNYGYAIIRGVTARSIASYGLLSSLGINHRSELNNFNLADDIMEAYRPAVDLIVFNDIVKDSNIGEIKREDKNKLISILSSDILIDNKLHSIQNAIGLTVKSYISSIKEKDSSKILLPTVITPVCPI